MHINDFDEYSLQYIFSYLPFSDIVHTLDKVCRYWRRLVKLGPFFYNCVFYHEKECVSYSPNIIKRILFEHKHDIRSLTLLCCDIHNELPKIFSLISKCDNLRDLRFISLQLEHGNYRHMIDIIRTRTQLCSFKIEKGKIHFGSGNQILNALNNMAVDSLSTLTLEIKNLTVHGSHLPIYPIKMHRITDLRMVIQNVVVNSRWTKDIIEANADHLKILKLDFLEPNSRLWEGDIFQTIGGCPNLITLSLKFFHFPRHDVLNDEGFRHFYRLQHLRKIVINHANGISKAAFQEFIELPHVTDNLAKLDFIGCRNFDREICREAYARCRNLKQIKVWREFNVLETD